MNVTNMKLSAMPNASSASIVSKGASPMIQSKAQSESQSEVGNNEKFSAYLKNYAAKSEKSKDSNSSNSSNNSKKHESSVTVSGTQPQSPAYETQPTSAELDGGTNTSNLSDNSGSPSNGFMYVNGNPEGGGVYGNLGGNLEAIEIIQGIANGTIVESAESIETVANTAITDNAESFTQTQLPNHMAMFQTQNESPNHEWLSSTGTAGGEGISNADSLTKGGEQSTMNVQNNNEAHQGEHGDKNDSNTEHIIHGDNTVTQSQQLQSAQSAQSAQASQNGVNLSAVNPTQELSQASPDSGTVTGENLSVTSIEGKPLSSDSQSALNDSKTSQIAETVGAFEIGETGETGKSSNVVSEKSDKTGLDSLDFSDSLDSKVSKIGANGETGETDKNIAHSTTNTVQTATTATTAPQSLAEQVSSAIIENLEKIANSLKATEVSVETPDKEVVAAKLESTEFKMTLNPEHLGKVSIRLISDGVKMSVLITAANDHVRDLLMSRAQSVRLMVELNGVSVERYEVVTARGEFTTQAAGQDFLDQEESGSGKGEQQNEQAQEGSDSQDEQGSQINFVELLQEFQSMKGGV